MENLGEQIRKDIIASGIPISKTAAKLGMSRQSLSQINLRKSFDLEFLQKLKNVTGLDYLDFYTKKPDKKYQTNDDVDGVREATASYISESKMELFLNIRITGKDSDFGNVYQFLQIIKLEAEKFNLLIA